MSVKKKSNNELLKLDQFNPEIYRTESSWQEGEFTVYRSHQWSPPGCHNACGVLFYVKDGKVDHVEGDPNDAKTHGRLCMRCLDLMEAIYHQDRLKYPMKRIGERGENKWERVSWEEAYDIIEENVRRVWADYGPESIVAMMGTGRNDCYQVPNLCYTAFDSPNFSMGFLAGDACMMPRESLMAIMCGSIMLSDCSQMWADRYENPNYQPPEIMMIWGNNPIVANADGFFGHWVVDLMKQGTELVVIDPKLTWCASRAKQWIRLRPGTDAALAMAMLNVIIEEDLYDHEFVESYCYGFDQLRERVATMPPSRAAEICWIEESEIYEAARTFAAARPGTVQWGLKLDQQITGVALAQAVCSIYVICGNMDVPGGNVPLDPAFGLDSGYNHGFHWIPQEVVEKRAGYWKYPLKRYGLGAMANGDSILELIESGDPYPIKMMWFQSTTAFTNCAAEAPRVYKAILKSDFNVVADPFMTPLAVGCADLVLPVAMSCERDSLNAYSVPLTSIKKVVEPWEDSKTDEEIMLDVIKRLHPERAPWNNVKEWLNSMLDRCDWTPGAQEGAPAPLNYDTLAEQGVAYPNQTYQKYAKGLIRPDGKPGFNTVTGKIELYLPLFESWGLDPLPYYIEPNDSPYKTPERYREYDLVLTTGRRSFEFFHSEHRQMKTMREFHPDPIIEVHSEAAKARGIIEGDWVWVENQRGKAKLKVMFNDTLDPRVVSAEHGWWFPEQKPEAPSLFGTFDCNINNLTPQCQNDQCGFGAPNACQLCKMYKVTSENSQITPGEIVTEKGGFGYVK